MKALLILLTLLICSSHAFAANVTAFVSFYINTPYDLGTYPYDNGTVPYSPNDVAVTVKIEGRLGNGFQQNIDTSTPNRVALSVVDFGDGTSDVLFSGVRAVNAYETASRTITHRYQAAGTYTIVARGLRYASLTEPYTGEAFSFTYTLTVGGVRRVPTLGDIRELTEVNTPMMEWNPRLAQSGQRLFFLSERSTEAEIYESTRQSDDTWGAPTPVQFASQPPAPIAAFDITPDARTILLRLVGIIPPATKRAPSLYIATRPDGNTGAFSAPAPIRLLDGSVVQRLRNSDNEWRQSRGLGISRDGLSIIVPFSALYSSADNPAPDVYLYDFLREPNGTDFQLNANGLPGDRQPRLMSTDGRYRVWAKPPTKENGPDAAIFACGDCSSPGNSVFTPTNRDAMEGRTTFSDFRSSLAQLATVEKHDATSNNTGPEVEIGAVAPDGSGFLFATIFKTGTGEMDLGWAALAPIPEEVLRAAKAR